MNSRFETPVLFLIFNRPDTTRLVLDQIRKIQPKYLYVAADGPRETVAGEKEKCEATRNVINQVDWDCEVKTLFRENNLGCGLGESTAMTWFFDQVPEGIILEDDCLPDLSFFPYCEELLTKYRDVDQVKLISGNNFQNGIVRGKGSYYFSNYLHAWGWASWRRAWNIYDFEMRDMEEVFQSKQLKHVFQSSSERKLWYRRFLDAKNKKVDTWDYQFMYEIWKVKGVVIHPNVNLVKNIGMFNNPTHVFLKDSVKAVEENRITFPLSHPEIKVDRAADQYVFSHLFSKSPQRLLRLLKENGLRNIIGYTLKKIGNKSNVG